MLNSVIETFDSGVIYDITQDCDFSAVSKVQLWIQESRGFYAFVVLLVLLLVVLLVELLVLLLVVLLVVLVEVFVELIGLLSGGSQTLV